MAVRWDGQLPEEILERASDDAEEEEGAQCVKRDIDNVVTRRIESPAA